MLIDFSCKNLSFLNIENIPNLDSPFILDLSNNNISVIPNLKGFKIQELIVKDNPIANPDSIFLKINSTNVGIGTKITVSLGSVCCLKSPYLFCF
jgi:Leucine-rich repeat (LRR) protein